VDSWDERVLASEIGWKRGKLRQVLAKLQGYVKNRAKDIPLLRNIMRGVVASRAAAEALCEKYRVLYLLLSGSFLPTRRSKSLAAIYEKYRARI
jgi:hypothetical protein